MSDEPLIVPIEVDALVVNDEVRYSVPFERWTAVYHRLSLGSSPEPQPFTNNDAARWDSQPDANGVYLHWQLPQTLRHGKHDAATGETAFPQIPNRWLVIRRRCDTAEEPVAWVVESDHVNGADEPGGSAFLRDDGGIPKAVRIGRRVKLTDWREEGSGESVALDALGPGLLTFSAYQPYNENVLSLHDTAADLGTLDAVLAYQVIGWHSDKAVDPLAIAQGDPHALNWVPPDGKATDRPTRSLYTGYVLRLPWQPKGTAPASQRPRGTQVKVAVGNSSVDALSGLLIAGGMDHGNAALLEALQHGLLNGLDDTAHESVDHAIHRSWFGTSPGGYAWEAVDAPGKKAVVVGEEQRRAERELLAELNSRQAAHDAAMRELAQLRWRLYALWWLNRDAGLSQQDRLAFERARGSLAGRISSVEKDLGRRRDLAGEHLHQEAIPWGATTAELTARAADYLCRFADTPWQGRQLKRVPLAEFHTPADPVVLLSGAGAPKTTAPGAPLPCRFPADTLKATGPVHRPPLAVPTEHLPEPQALRELVDEFSLVSSTAANDLDALRHTPVSQGANGIPPHYGLTPWAQPWQPLYLLYEVRYFAIPYHQKHGDPWEFNGSRYQWNGKSGPGPLDFGTCRGRIHLTPHATFNLSGRLREYQRVHPAAASGTELGKALTTLAEEVATWDVLSQSLDGLTQWVAARGIGIHPQPHGNELAALIGHEHQTVPLPDASFSPLRAGQFRFNRLAIVDRFGQVCDVINPVGTGGPSDSLAKELILANSVRPEQPVLPHTTRHTFAELRPRLVQGARLRFEPLTPDGSAIGPGADPVCGWLLPNHLDSALQVFAPDGRALGELRPAMLGKGSGGGLAWDAAPDAPYRDPADEEFPGQLGAMLQEMLDEYAAETDFAALRATIDETLFTVNPLGGWDDLSMAVLAGRPLALVHARLWFELEGPPLINPGQETWRHDPAGEPESAEFLTHPWYIRLGSLADQDDGLIGCFLGDDYSRLYTVHQPLDSTSQRVIRIDRGFRLAFQDASGKGCRQTVTLLVDPRAAVHAVTDLLPATALSIPAVFVEPGLRRLRVSFRAGPLLAGTVPATDPDHPSGPHIPALAVPRPSTRHGSWTWHPAGAGDPLPLAPQGHAATTSPIAQNGRLIRGGPLDR
ncbi:hypothetical protein [Streptomyces sp. S186]|uniref:hypothetical protein n=1 Tax=Streptomyces sp. S186 TaxID=3434395 RepID=UPI003F66FEAE